MKTTLKKSHKKSCKKSHKKSLFRNKRNTKKIKGGSKIKFINANYEGEETEGVPNGQGVMTFTNFMYEGTFVNGLLKKGTITYKDKSKILEGLFQEEFFDEAKMSKMSSILSKTKSKTKSRLPIAKFVSIVSGIIKVNKEMSKDELLNMETDFNGIIEFPNGYYNGVWDIDGFTGEKQIKIYDKDGVKFVTEKYSNNTRIKSQVDTREFSTFNPMHM